MEHSIRCSEDSFDAIYICSCLKRLCSKHYFSHTAEFPSHKVGRIKFPVNNKSKQILINLVLSVKQEITKFFNKWSEESSSIEITENFITESKFFSDILSLCDKSLRFLMMQEAISFKLIFHPLEYFLIKPSIFAQKYVESIKIPKELPKNFSDIHDSIFFKCLFDFNYFQFENQRYIFNFWYEEYYNRCALSKIIWPILIGTIKASAYEIAHEIILGLQLNYEISPLSQEESDFFSQLNGIISIFINGITLTILKEKLEEVETNISYMNHNWKLTKFYEIFSIMFQKLNDKQLAYYCLQKIIDNFCKNKNEREANYYKLKLGWLYYENKNYEAAKSYSKEALNAIIFYNKSESLELLNGSYFLLASVYSEMGNKEKKLKKIIKIIKNEVQFYRNESEFNEVICKFYCLTNDYDTTNKMLWKISKKTNHMANINNSSLFNKYLSLGYNYMKMKDYKWAIKSFINAKSCCGILPMGSPQIKYLYIALGKLYYNLRSYEEALGYFKNIESYCTNMELQKIKFVAGLTFFELRKNDESLIIFHEVKELILYCEQINKSHLCVINIMIGELHNREDDYENALSSFIEAFRNINDYDYCLYDTNISSVWYLFYYFLKISDHNKCETILLRIDEILKNSSNKEHRLSDALVMCAEMNIDLGKPIEIVEHYLQKAESAMKIDEFLSNSHNNTNSLSYADILKCIRIEKIHIKWQSDDTYLRVEKILKYCEAVLNRSFFSNWYPIADLCDLLGNLYNYQGRLEEAKIYYTKSLDLHIKHEPSAIIIEEIEQCLKNIERKMNENQEK